MLQSSIRQRDGRIKQLVRRVSGAGIVCEMIVAVCAVSLMFPLIHGIALLGQYVLVVGSCSTDLMPLPPAPPPPASYYEATVHPG